MRHFGFFVALVLACMASQPAMACRIRAQIDLNDIRYADLVVVGRISNYRLVRDEAFRRQMLARPNLSPEVRAIYEGPGSLMPDYARFDIQVDEVLVGEAHARLTATWDNSTFNEPERMAAGPFLIALRRPASASLPLRGPSATFFQTPEPNLFTLLQAPCASPFLFESASDQAGAVRRILGSS